MSGSQVGVSSGFDEGSNHRGKRFSEGVGEERRCSEEEGRESKSEEGREGEDEVSSWLCWET